MTPSPGITLEQLLDAREHRAAHQKVLLVKYKLPLVSFTVNIPGPNKKTYEGSIIFREGSNAVMEKLKQTCGTLEYDETNEPDTGYEAYFVVNTTERALKALMLEIESDHPLGRLFDLDVIGADGKPISREDLGKAKRKCLLCDKDAHVCGRSRRHSTEALLTKIQRMVDSYVKI